MKRVAQNNLEISTGLHCPPIDKKKGNTIMTYTA